MQALADSKAADLAASLSRLQELIESLPDDFESEEQQLQQLAKVLQANAEATAEVQQSRAEAENRLARLQEVHALLAEAQLCARDK